MAGVTKFTIAGLSPNETNIMIIGIIIAKQEPRVLAGGWKGKIKKSARVLFIFSLMCVARSFFKEKYNWDALFYIATNSQLSEFLKPASNDLSVPYTKSYAFTSWHYYVAQYCNLSTPSVHPPA
jgi:hypothetical protein